MKITSKFGLMASGAAAATLLMLGTAASYPSIAQAAGQVAALPGTAITASTPVTGTNPLTGTMTTPNQGKGGRGLLNQQAVDTDKYFADALGITTDELSAARVKAAGAALDQAVQKGYLTQQQADALKTQVETAAKNGTFRLSGGRFAGLERLGINPETLLADALGIKVDALNAAQVKAYQAIVDQAVKDGRITQDQADLMAARQAFRLYEMSQQKSYADQVAAAVQAGAITQAQADLLLKNQPGMLNGMNLFGGMQGGRGMEQGERGFGGQGFGGQGGRGMQGGRGGHGFGGQGFGGQNGQQGMPGLPGDNNGQDNNPQGNVPVAPSAGL